MDNTLEKLALVTEEVDTAATKAARRAEVEKGLASYRSAQRGLDAAEIAEMRAAFGSGSTVQDVLTGEKIEL